MATVEHLFIGTGKSYEIQFPKFGQGRVLD